ncbi:YfhO family protein [Candidatus Desantisbacteria bacterium]|nr:YfhO family protein [Candidatus Desantisbacteria bacterium]
MQKKQVQVKKVITAHGNENLFSRSVQIDRLIIIGIILLFCGIWLFKGCPERDFLGNIPHLWYVKNALMEFGCLPGWCHWWGCGVPTTFLNSIILSHLMITPFTFIFNYIDAQKIVMLLFHILAGFSIYHFALYILKDQDAALFAGCIYPIAPIYISISALWGFPTISLSYAFVPFLFFLYTKVLREPHAKNTLLCGIFSFLMFWLDNERTLTMFPFLAFIFLFETYQQWRTLRSLNIILKNIVQSSIIATIAGGLSAFFLIPVLIEGKFHKLFSEDTILRCIDEYTLKNLLDLIDREGIISTWLANSGITGHESIYYIGIVLLALGIAAFLFRKTLSPSVRNYPSLFFCCTLMGVWLSFGSASVYERMLFIIKKADVMPWVIVGVVIASGLLIYWIYLKWVKIKGEKQPTVRMRRNIIVLLTIIAGAALFLFFKPFMLLRDLIPVYSHMRTPGYFMVISSCLFPTLMGSFFIIILKNLPASMGLKRGIFAMIIFLIIIDVSPYRKYFMADYKTEPFNNLIMANKYIKGDPDNFKTMTVEPYSPISDMGLIYSEKPSAWCWVHWMMPKDSGKYMSYVLSTLYPHFYNKKNICSDNGVRYVVDNREGRMTSQLAGIANVKYLIDNKLLPPQLNETEYFKKVYDSPYFAVFKNKNWKPWIQSYSTSLLYPGGEASGTFPLLETLTMHGVAMINGNSEYLEDYSVQYLKSFDMIYINDIKYRQKNIFNQIKQELGSKLIISGQKTQMPIIKKGSGCSPTIKRTTHHPERIGIEVVTPEVFILMFSESWYPYWHVYIDGKESKLLRVNYGFMGVKVDKGNHKIEFKYKKQGYLTGYIISLLTGCILVGIFLFSTVWKRVRG